MADTRPRVVSRGRVIVDGNGDVVALGGSGTTAQEVQGNVAHDAVVSGNPFAMAGYGANGFPAATSADGDLTRVSVSRFGEVRMNITNTVNSNNSVETVTFGGVTCLQVAAHVAPNTSGGLTPSRIVTGTSGVIKASAGQAYKVTAYNVNAAVRYLHLYNKATAPTLSTDTPVITITLLGASVREIDMTDIGAAFSTGIAWAYTTDDIAIPATAATSTELHATVLYN